MQFRKKIPTFIFGVSIGLLVGVAFFVFKINDVFNRLKDATKEQITVIEQPIKNVNPDENKNNQSNSRYKINLGQTKKVNYKEVDSLIKADSDINIATDELLSVKSLKVIRIGRHEAVDTSAQNLANISESNNDLYFIEFWKTPLNSKGYRFTKNKILLYGFMDYNNVLLYELDNAFYIKSADQVYRIFYDADFKPLERVMDSDLLAKMN
ncbi:MAG: hypothetical protein WCR21_07445 [Bacteroidota bacterium]